MYKFRKIGSRQVNQNSNDFHNYRSVVFPFAIAETLVWAAYFYSFPAFLPIWENDLGFSRASLTGAFTISLLVSALLSPLIGRLIDQGYGRFVFAGSAALASLMLLLLSGTTQIWQFYFIWVIIGISMSGSLYDACFAILTYSLGNKAKRAITLITIAAGFAGTVSFTSAHLLSELYGWRTAILIFSLTVALVCVPLILYGSKYTEQQSKLNAAVPSKRIKDALFIVKAPSFWFIGIAFFLISINHGIVLSHMLPIFKERGLTVGVAVLMASLLGPMQVVGRLAMLIIENHVSIFAICIASFTAMFIAGLVLYFGSAVVGLIFLFVVAQGCGYGVVIITRPMIIAQLLGRNDFGVVAGLLAMGFLIGTAVAPSLGSLLWLNGGYDLVILVAICIPILAVVSLIGAWRYQS